MYSKVDTGEKAPYILKKQSLTSKLPFSYPHINYTPSKADVQWYIPACIFSSQVLNSCLISLKLKIAFFNQRYFVSLWCILTAGWQIHSAGLGRSYTGPKPQSSPPSPCPPQHNTTEQNWVKLWEGTLWRNSCYLLIQMKQLWLFIGALIYCAGLPS